MVESQVRFSDLTTLGVGGPIETYVEATTTADLIRVAADSHERGRPFLALGGGSNLVVSDEGFDGVVLAVRTSGRDVNIDSEGHVRVRVAAGEAWDSLVEWSVDQGFSGIEALSGIPGLVGAAPIQNIGAYGQEVADTIVSVDVFECDTGEIVQLSADELGFAYRDSIFKRGRDAIVLGVEFELADARSTRVSSPIAYEQLASALGVEQGDALELGRVRESVLTLRRAKGMVLDELDSDTRSVGSFFVNPIVTERFARTLPSAAPRFPVTEETSERVLEIGADVPPLADPGLVKLSAAWLIENAGVPRGFSLPGSRAAVSTKHSLALCNRGGATAEDVASLARYIRTLVQSQFGVSLQPEPHCLGIDV